ncbi:hypothetical protein KKB43_01075 [Patescibacteria group bacterium]|nr:hypothetical protein [Patescibacteria group bacterium]MBU4579590.1 hypothetical protein [Patescibacteria group bacterium]
MTMEKPPENFEKSDREELKKECLVKFVEYRHGYIDELPPHRLMPGDENYHRYKCRGNLFAGVKYDISNLIDEGILSDPAAIQKGREYMDYVAKRDFSKFSTQEDIDKINEILDIMIKSLS